MVETNLLKSIDKIFKESTKKIKEADAVIVA